MFTSLGRAALALPVLLALAAPARAERANHLAMGNPSAATPDKGKPDNYLVRKHQYALSYNNSKGTPNWVSWHLSKEWLGKTRRGNPFAPDLSLPEGFFAVRPNDYRGSGFDRGHVCPAADRSVSPKDMDATFLMSNMMPQSPDLNRKTWEHVEAYCRDQARKGQELYLVAGPTGQGGVGSAGERAVLRARGGKVVVPSKCWKVVLVLPAGVTNPRRVTAQNARVFAAIFPNVQGLDTNWRNYAVPVAEVEKLTGYSFFTALPADLAKELRLRKPQTRAGSGAVEAKEERPTRKGDTAGQLRAFQKGCVIGNKRSKVYHLPGGSGYEGAKKSKNAVFFRDAKAAEAAGYRAAKR
jgi:endonuclease G